MAHVTFIHGIQNKPSAERLLQFWRAFLADPPGGIGLQGESIGSSMVYWADVLYANPQTLAEGAEQPVQAPAVPSVDEAAFIAGLAAKVGGTLAARDLVGGTGPQSERIPLPWPVKKAFLDAFLRDVHHYLFDVDFSPRPGTRYRVRQEIRHRFVRDLAMHAGGDGPHIVVSHSMGTVIAYDCLKNVGECPTVDAFVTLGSPLGLDEVQDKLAPGYSRSDGFPSERVRGTWVNVFDRLDPVDGFDPVLADDFKRDDTSRIIDVEVVNSGIWRHGIQEYLQRDELRAHIRRLLGLDARLGPEV